MPLIFFFHTTTHVSLNRKRSACRFLLKQQKLLLQLDWLLPYLLLLQLLLKKQLLPSHALMLRLHLEPCWRLRWSQSSLARQKRAHGCGPSERAACKVTRDLCETQGFWGQCTGRFWAEKCVLQPAVLYLWSLVVPKIKAQFNYLRKR